MSYSCNRCRRILHGSGYAPVATCPDCEGEHRLLDEVKGIREESQRIRVEAVWSNKFWRTIAYCLAVLAVMGKTLELIRGAP